MLRTNLSTRPFYNLRAVKALIGITAVVVLAFTLYNAVEVVRLVTAQRSLGAHAAEAEREADRLRADAGRIRSQIDPRELNVVSAAAREANEIIDRRTFSWSQLFAQFESTLPNDVRITAVQPRLNRDGNFIVAIEVESRRVEDLDMFLHALESDGTFRDVLAVEEATNENGLLEATIEGVYAPTPRVSAEQGGARP